MLHYIVIYSTLCVYIYIYIYASASPSPPRTGEPEVQARRNTLGLHNKIPFTRFSPGSGLLRNPFVHR